MNSLLRSFGIGLIFCAVWIEASVANPDFINPDTEAARQAPYSQAVKVNDMLILSGQLGIGESGLVEGGIVPETHQIMRNIENILAGQGAGLKIS